MSMDKRGARSWRFRVKHKKQLYTMNYTAPDSLTEKQAEREAKKQHDIFKFEVQQGKVGLYKDVTMNQLIDLVWKEYVLTNVNYGTSLRYKTCYNKYVIPYFKNMNIKDIKPIHVQQFANKLDSILKPGTVKGILGILKKTLDLAEKWELLEISPYRNIERKKVRISTNHELLNYEQLQILFDYYNNVEPKPYQKLAFYLAIGCGLRNSEIRALTIDDFDFENNTVTISKQLVSSPTGEVVSDTKTTASMRTIYMPAFVAKYVKEYINMMPAIPMSKQLFFNFARNQPYGPHALSQHLKSVLRILNLPVIRFHDLRHLQATLLIQNNVNVKAVSKRLGHSNVDITLNTYTNTFDSVDKEVAEKLDNIVKSLSQNKSVH